MTPEPFTRTTPVPHRKQTKRWTMQDGTKIRICDMDDNHLVNTVRMLQRNARVEHFEALHAAYQLESVLHGDMALLCIGEDIDSLESTDPEESGHPLYFELCTEAERRGIVP